MLTKAISFLIPNFFLIGFIIFLLCSTKIIKNNIALTNAGKDYKTNYYFDNEDLNEIIYSYEKRHVFFLLFNCCSFFDKPNYDYKNFYFGYTLLFLIKKIFKTIKIVVISYFIIFLFFEFF